MRLKQAERELRTFAEAISTCLRGVVRQCKAKWNWSLEPMKKKVLKGFRSRDVVAGFLSQI